MKRPIGTQTKFIIAGAIGLGIYLLVAGKAKIAVQTSLGSVSIPAVDVNEANQLLKSVGVNTGSSST